MLTLSPLNSARSTAGIPVAQTLLTEEEKGTSPQADFTGEKP